MFRAVCLLIVCHLLFACSSSDEQKEFAVEGVGDVTYRVIFKATWSAATHPDDFPSNPHFSGLIGATHNLQANFWGDGQIASSGIESMAETGSKTELTEEINQQINIGDADKIISVGGIARSPDQIEITSFPVSGDFPYITLVSMLAPSPDWFVGVAGLSLIENGLWIENKTIDLFVYDAGTDDGATYTSPDADSNPKQPISQFTTKPFLIENEVKWVAQFIFEKI